MIKIENLCKSYSPNSLALRDVSLVIEKGIHGLLGPNGAGKTTLMRVLATLLTPSSGEVAIFSHSLAREKQAIRRLLGYLPQRFGFYPDLSAAETLDYFALLQGISSATIRRQKVQYALELVNLWNVQGERVHTFSGGMTQRLGIAQMLLSDPKLIIVDEPTAGLDPEERISFRNLLGRLFSENQDRVVIISTHIIDDLTYLTNQLSVLSIGKIAFSGTGDALASLARGKVFEVEIPGRQLPEFQKEHVVISVTQTGTSDIVSLRLLKGAQDLPQESRPLPPTIEDGYLAMLRKAEVNGVQINN